MTDLSIYFELETQRKYLGHIITDVYAGKYTVA